MKAEDIQQDKLKLISWISQSQDFSLLQKLKHIFEEEAIVAYSTDGKPLTLKKYNQSLEKSEKDIKSGRVSTTDELRKTIASWRK